MSRLDAILATPKVTHELVQGTAEWDKFRAEHRGASEAAAALGLSKKVTRTELLTIKQTGLAREFGQWLQKNVLDKGHELEALARPHVEALIGEDLYPVTCSRGILSASCDGLTMDDRRAFEHKQWNEELAASVRAGIVPDEHLPQCHQVLLVTGAEELIFVVSDGTPDRMVHTTVKPDHAWWKRIVDGWAQFDEDLATFTPPAAAALVVPVSVQALPSVLVKVSGSIAVTDNFAAFRTALDDFLEHRLIRQPKTDQDFADLDVQIKAMKGAEAALDSAESQMLAQIEPVDVAVKTKAALRKLVTDNRIMAEKLLASEKERRRGEIVASGVTALREYVASRNEKLGRPYMPVIQADFAGCIKGKSNLAKMEDAVASELARAKIAATEVFDRIQANMQHLVEHAGEHKGLFPDTPQIVLKDPQDLQALVTARIAEFKAAEQKRLDAERERIRIEEVDKLRREQEARDAEAARAAASAAAAPAATPAPAPIAAAAAVVSMRSGAVPPKASPPSTPPSLRIGEIANRLGFGITAAFLRQLGFEPAGKEGASVLFHEHQFPLMCEALVAHVRTVQAKQDQLQAA